MLRTLLVAYTIFEFAVITALYYPVFAFVALWKRNTDPANRARGRVMRSLGRVTSSVTPLWRFKVRGAVPPELYGRAFVATANHESMADPFILSHLPFDMRFIGKEELWKLPVLGPLFRMGGDICVRRGKGDSVRAMMAECRKTLAANFPVLLFPEGTRSKDGKLLPFKDGAFTLAIEAQVPILPLAIVGTRACLPKGKRFLGMARAEVKVLAPISTTGLTLADLPALREQVRELIGAHTVANVLANAEAARNNGRPHDPDGTSGEDEEDSLALPATP